jgi:alpha-D-xyloside xylohydrolase
MLMQAIAMPIQKLLCSTLVLLLTTNTIRANGIFRRTPDGVIVYPDSRFSGHTAAVRLYVVADNIIRVLCSPAGDPVRETESLITTYTTESSLHWQLTQPNDSVITLTTSRLIASVVLSTGAIRFADSSGRPILAEKAFGGRAFDTTVSDGSPQWQFRQTFETLPDEALYGLGQHQDGWVNCKGRQVLLFQNNTEVAVPFLLSSRNYGILWDNYSVTTVGDIRPYRSLSALRLYSARGEQGWLTATYHNRREQPVDTGLRLAASDTGLQLASSDIDYAWLGDSKILLPAAFAPAKGSVTWDGAIATGTSGDYLFRFTYAGYLKIYIDGQLRLDRWRQPWNPGSAVLTLPMEKDRKVSIKIEWAPDGGESYLTLKWMGPPSAGCENDFSFASTAGRQMDYYFIYGNNPDGVIAGYRLLTGKATIPPRWALGFWQSRERYKTESEILSTVKAFRDRKIPLDNIVLDWSYWPRDAWGSQDFDPARFPTPDSMIRALHDDYHTHFMISVWPKFYESIPAYKEFDQNHWLYKRNIADHQRDWIGEGYVSTFYDAFNGGARRGFWDLLNNKLFTKGVDAWWMDASEPDILSNVPPEKRISEMTPTALGPAAEYLNAYPLENARGIYEGQRAAKPDQRVFILTRSAFAGSQRYAAAVWSGDIAARWSDMRSQIAAGIGFSMSGLPYWTMDIGGFAVEHRFEQAKGEDLEEWREQMTRWYQFGAFCPLFRVHGQFPYREIYNVAPEDHPAYKSMLYYDKLRYRLLPYLYSLAGKVWRDDYTLMRGLAMDFGADTTVRDIADEFMLGPSILAAPVTQYKARDREVYLPAGQGWYDLYTGDYTAGGRWVLAAAPYERMPAYIKEGSILPIGPELQYTDQRPADTVKLCVYTGRDADFTLYEDEGTNYNYEKGRFATIPFHYDEDAGTLTIGQRNGLFPGILLKRTFRIERIGRSTQLPFGGKGKHTVVVTYTGGEKTLSLR